MLRIALSFGDTGLSWRTRLRQAWTCLADRQKQLVHPCLYPPVLSCKRMLWTLLSLSRAGGPGASCSHSSASALQHKQAVHCLHQFLHEAFGSVIK